MIEGIWYSFVEYFELENQEADTFKDYYILFYKGDDEGV